MYLHHPGVCSPMSWASMEHTPWRARSTTKWEDHNGATWSISMGKAAVESIPGRRHFAPYGLRDDAARRYVLVSIELSTRQVDCYWISYTAIPVSSEHSYAERRYCAHELGVEVCIIRPESVEWRADKNRGKQTTHPLKTRVDPLAFGQYCDTDDCDMVHPSVCSTRTQARTIRVGTSQMVASEARRFTAQHSALDSCCEPRGVRLAYQDR